MGMACIGDLEVLTLSTDGGDCRAFGVSGGLGLARNTLGVKVKGSECQRISQAPPPPLSLLIRSTSAASRWWLITCRNVSYKVARLFIIPPFRSEMHEWRNTHLTLAFLDQEIVIYSEFFIRLDQPPNRQPLHFSCPLRSQLVVNFKSDWQRVRHDSHPPPTPVKLLLLLPLPSVRQSVGGARSR